MTLKELKWDKSTL